MIEKIENIILDKLKEKFEEFEVDSFPKNFEDYSPTNPNGCILVRFENSKSTGRTVSANHCDETYNFSIFADIRYAYKHCDCYPFLHKLKKTLNGLNILNKRLYITKREFIDDIAGDLWYGYSVEVELPTIDEYPDLSRANQIEFKL